MTIKLDSKYRPKNFEEIIGQKAVSKVLVNSINREGYETAYMFSGPSGSGKTTVGRVLANAILCTSEGGNKPCGECESCKFFQDEKHFGYKEIDAATYSGKDDVIALRDDAFFHPIGGRKIILLDECHDLSKQGQDALLKQVEECPEHLTYIFCTTDPDKMSTTLRSRCMEFQINSSPSSDISDRLEFICKKENIPYKREVLDLIAEKSGSNFREAINTLEKMVCFNGSLTEDIKELSRNYDQEVTDFLLNIGVDVKKTFEICNNLSSKISDRSFYNIVISLLNDTTKLIFGYDSFSQSRKILLEKISSRHGLIVVEFLDYLIQRDKYIDKTGFFSDVILLHYKFYNKSFKPREIEIRSSDVSFEPSIPENITSQIQPIKSKLSQSELCRLEPKEKNRILRQQHKNFQKQDEQKSELVPTEWPLPKQERIGEDSLDSEVLSPQEFSLNLLGGRIAKH